MNGRVFLQTEHVELSLTPNLEEAVVVLTVESPTSAVMLARPMGMILLTPAGARSLAIALRQVIASPEGDPCVISVPDQCCVSVVEPSPYDEGVVVTASAHPPHATGRRGVTLHFTLEPQDTAHLAELLEKTAPLADPAGGAA